MLQKRNFNLLQRLGVVLVLLTLLLAAPAGPAFAEEETGNNNTIQGAVLFDGAATPALGAKVVATQPGKASRSTTVSPSGAYTLAVSEGTWLVTVKPPAISETSPDWVYTGDAQPLAFTSNPDPSEPIKTLNFSVAAATATLTGQLLVPTGSGATFATPNRAWVKVVNQEGDGNTVLADAAGNFSVKVQPGNVSPKVTLENDDWFPPVELSGLEVTLKAGDNPLASVADQVFPAGTIQLLEKKAYITGVVVDQTTNLPVPNVPVRAWRVDGTEVADTLSDGSGVYFIKLIQGNWRLRAIPGAAQNFVAAESPQRVFLPSETSNAYQTLKVAPVDATMNGQIVDQNGNNLTISRGRVYPVWKEGKNWVQLGQGMPVVNGVFTVRFASSVATNYRLKGSFPEDSGVTAADDVPVTITSGFTSDITFPVAAFNATISGTFLKHDDQTQAQTGVPGIVYTGSNTGALAKDRINPQNGQYLINVATTDTAGRGGTFWRLHAYVDPTTGYIVQPPRHQRVFIAWNGGAGEDKQVDFVVAKINAAISGQVLDPQGNPVRGAKVYAKELLGSEGSPFQRWKLTDDTGHFSIKVTAGKYEVSAAYRNWIAPLIQTVSVAADEMGTVSLQFRPKAVRIKGTVMYNSAPHIAFIRATSDTGAKMSVKTGSAGNFSMYVNANDTWHLQAVSEEGENYLASSRVEVDTPASGNVEGVTLDLKASDTLPEDISFTFDATIDQSFLLSNGSQVVIPAYAMADSGNVTLVVRALTDLADADGAKPVSFGYRLLAYDQSHMPVVRFAQAITINVPFTAAQLASLGVTPDQLIPQYWDNGTQSWKPVNGYSVSVNDDGSGTLNFSVDHFTDFAAMVNANNRYFMPLIGR
jgi:hypothetical protein